MRFDGRDITRASTHEIARGGIGWVPDDRRIFPTLTVARNLAIARKKTRFRSWTEKECFEIFSALEYLMHRECENLSGGEMQMVAISRALIGAPGLVLFDEPSQGLAPKVVQDVMKTIARLKREGIAVLLVEQNVHSALQVADRAYVMNLGRHRPRRSGRAAARRRRAAPAAAGGVMATPLLARRAAWPSSTPAACFSKQVTFSLAADFTIDEPGVVGVMGPNGSGKTTLFELITGSNLPTRRPRAGGRPGHPSSDARASATGWRSTTTSPTRCAPSSAASPTSCWSMPRSESPLVHLFDEPQFNTQDGYIGFMLDFFRQAARASGKLVFLCLHPNEQYHIDILRAELRAVHLRAKGRRDAGARLRYAGAGRTGARLPGGAGERSCSRSRCAAHPRAVRARPRTSPGSPGWPSRPC